MRNVHDLRVAIPAACLLLALAGCSADGTRSAGPFEPQLAGVGLENRPFGGRCDTRFTFTGPTSLILEMDCQIRGMGRVTGLATQTLTFTPTGILVENTGVYTTSNGDELHSTFSGLGMPDQSQTVITLSGTEFYSGGTGRFANASGSAELTGAASLATMTGAFTTLGTLTF